MVEVCLLSNNIYCTVQTTAELHVHPTSGVTVRLSPVISNQHECWRISCLGKRCIVRLGVSARGYSHARFYNFLKCTFACQNHQRVMSVSPPPPTLWLGLFPWLNEFAMRRNSLPGSKRRPQRLLEPCDRKCNRRLLGPRLLAPRRTSQTSLYEGGKPLCVLCDERFEIGIRLGDGALQRLFQFVKAVFEWCA